MARATGAERQRLYRERMTPEERERARQWQKAYRAKNLERVRAQGRAWYHRNRDRARHNVLMKRHGISLEEFDRMLAEQGGGCAICGRPPNGHGALHVDHCHTTGKIRGLLCFSCNYAVGALQDEPDLFELAAEYLRAA